jgi:predicted protein tyrosine phosphatase
MKTLSEAITEAQAEASAALEKEQAEWAAIVAASGKCDRSAWRAAFSEWDEKSIHLARLEWPYPR